MNRSAHLFNVSSALDADFSDRRSVDIEIESVDSYYTQPTKVSLKAPCSLKEFWLSDKRLPQNVETPSNASIPAIVVKKGGDFPPFWTQDISFLEVMEELYQRVKAKGLN